MSVIPKVTLRKILSQTELVDPQGITPFVALHLGRCDNVHVRRTSAVGYVETVGAPPQGDSRWVYVSYQHVQDCLRFIDSEEVELSLLSNGGLVLKAANSPFETDLRVHTVDSSRSGFKRHDPGGSFKAIDPSWLGGFSVKPLNVSAPPVIAGNKLILVTPAGVVMVSLGQTDPLPTNPRASFLKAISGVVEGVMDLSDNGFFRFSSDGVTVVTAGHQGHAAASLTQMLLSPSSGPALRFPGPRIIHAMKAVAALAHPLALVQMSPRTGISSKDGFGNPCRFGLGDVPAFNSISMSNKTSQLIAEALGQIESEAVSLAFLGGPSGSYRMRRGSCYVVFGTIPAKD